MQIMVNGQPETVEAGSTVASVISQHDLQPVRVAVEVNEDLVPRKNYTTTQLYEGDSVEIVTFVGGG